MSDKTTNIKRHIICNHKPKNPEPTPKDEISKTRDKISNTKDEISNEKDEISKGRDEISKDIDEMSTSTDSGLIKCEKCYKMLSCKLVLKRHSKVCKGITSPLQCSKCHSIFTSPQNKSYHMKKCTGPPPPTPSIQNISNITNIDQLQNANTINNTTNNNNTIINNTIIFNNENIEFDDSHITKRDIKKIFDGADKQTVGSMVLYGHKILENTNNRCIKKKHITNAYCKVHVGNDKWEQRPDIPVIDRFSQDVAISANDKLYNYPNIGEPVLRDEIAHLASHPENVHANAINLRREMRTLLLNTSNDVNNKK
jgi:hypothetical protein